MNFFITLSKRSLSIILSIIIIGFILVSQVFSQKASEIDGSTNEIRVQYLKGLKLEVDDSDVTSKDITIPQIFSKVYENYNNLQKKSGFDLSKYKGKPATVYTYKLAGTKKLSPATKSTPFILPSPSVTRTDTKEVLSAVTVVSPFNLISSVLKYSQSNSLPLSLQFLIGCSALSVTVTSNALST